MVAFVDALDGGPKRPCIDNVPRSIRRATVHAGDLDVETAGLYDDGHERVLDRDLAMSDTVMMGIERVQILQLLLENRKSA